MPSSNQKEIAKDSQISPLWPIPVVLITVILTGLIMRLFIKKKK
jgi:hypothetical protein